MIPEYPVFINKPYKQVKAVATFLMVSSFLGIGFIVLIEPFAQVLTGTLNPEGLLQGGLGFLFLGITGFLLRLVKQNKAARLKIHEEAVEVLSMAIPIKICFNDLKRIGFIISTFSLRPYSIEFVYPDYRLIRVKLKTRQEFYEIMDCLYKVTPNALAKEVFTSESVEK